MSLREMLVETVIIVLGSVALWLALLGLTALAASVVTLEWQNPFDDSFDHALWRGHALFAAVALFGWSRFMKRFL